MLSLSLCRARLCGKLKKKQTKTELWQKEKEKLAKSFGIVYTELLLCGKKEAFDLPNGY